MSEQLDRIRALLRKSEADGVTKDEGEALYNKAFELAAKYEIDWELAKRKEPERKPDVAGVPRHGTVSRPLHQMIVLASIVHKFCGAKIVQTGKDTYLAHGTDADLDRAELLFTSLLMQGMRWQLNDYRSSGAADDGERRSTYKRSWWQGFGNELFDRFERIRGAAVKQAEATTGTPGVALMLRDKESLVEASIASRHSNLRKGRGSRTSGSGYGAGKEAGSRADIGGSTLTGRQRAIGQ